MLCGRFPFYGKTQEETVRKIIDADLEFKGKLIKYPVDSIWESISAGVKDFIKMLLQHCPEDRPTAKEALQNPWIRKHFLTKSYPNTNLAASLGNLRNFNVQINLQKAVLSYIASQELTKTEEKILKEIFELVDTNNDGQISKEELANSYLLFGLSESVARDAASEIMNKLDMNQNGSIDYNEFLIANLSVTNAITTERLKRAFNFFDIVKCVSNSQNKDGVITVDELRTRFGGFCTEEVIVEVFKEADIDGDGIISQDDFKKMMKQYMSSCIVTC